MERRAAMLSKTTSAKSIKRLVRISTAHGTVSLTGMEVNDRGYAIGCCDMEAGEDTQRLAVCFYREGPKLAAAYGFGAAPEEFTAYAHNLTGAPKWKLYRAACRGDLPQWVLNEIGLEASRKARREKEAAQIQPGPITYTLEAYRALKNKKP
jgi:hypothetical protein